MVPEDCCRCALLDVPSRCTTARSSVHADLRSPFHPPTPFSSLISRLTLQTNGSNGWANRETKNGTLSDQTWHRSP